MLEGTQCEISFSTQNNKNILNYIIYTLNFPRYRDFSEHSHFPATLHPETPGSEN